MLVEPGIMIASSFKLEPELDVGNIEYKRHLLTHDNDRLDHLTTQLSFRLHEGKGNARYYIGVEDDGSLSRLNLEDIERSISTLIIMAESISAKATNVERIEYKIMTHDGTHLDVTYYYAAVSLEACYEDETSKVDIRVAVCGNVDVGKSTCIGVMKTGILDDGRGSARASTMTLQHEIETGRTSTVSHHVIGFKENGKIANYDHIRPQSVDLITHSSAKLITLVDLAGHEKYLKSMIYGVSSCLLDYALVLINARSGVSHMTHHHLTVCSAMNIPVVILFTKTDSCPVHRYKQTVAETKELLKAPDIRKKLITVNTVSAKGSNSMNENKDQHENGAAEADSVESKTATAAAMALHSALACLTATRQIAIPAFPVSFTEGTNLEFLRRIFRFLPKRRKHADKKNDALEYLVDRIYTVPGQGPILYGFVSSGTVTIGKAVWLGPFPAGLDGKGEFCRTIVKSIHFNCLPLKTVGAGKFCTIAVKLDRSQTKLLRRGMVLMEAAPIATRRFKAKISIMYSQSSSIRVGYVSHLNILMVRQAAIVEAIEIISRGATTATRTGDHETVMLRPGDVSIITFRFINRAEYIREHMRVMFRDGKVKGIGIISELLDSSKSSERRELVEPLECSAELMEPLCSPRLTK